MQPSVPGAQRSWFKLLPVIVVHEMVVAGVVWGVGYWLIKVPGRVLNHLYQYKDSIRSE